MSRENGSFGLIIVAVVESVAIVIVVGSLVLESFVVRCLLDMILGRVNPETMMVVVVMCSGDANV